MIGPRRDKAGKGRGAGGTAASIARVRLANVQNKGSNVHSEKTRDNNYNDHHANLVENTHLFSPIMAIEPSSILRAYNIALAISYSRI